MGEVLINNVLVEPTPDNDSFGDFKIYDFVDPQRHVSVFGRVLATPTIMNYHADEIALLNEKNPVELKRIQHLRIHSLDFKTKCEIKVGDLVMFKYGYQIENDREKIGKNLVIPYDGLYAAFREDKVIMLNGYILVEPPEIEQDKNNFIGDFQLKKNEIIKGEGTIRHLGSMVEYLDYPARKDRIFLNVNDYIYFESRNAVRVEWGLHNTLNPSGRPLMRIQRKDIFSKKQK